MTKPKKWSLGKRELQFIIVIFTASLYFAGWQITGKYIFDDYTSIRSDINILKEEQMMLLSLAEEGELLEKNFSKEKEQHEQLNSILPDLDMLPMVLSDMESFLAEKPVAINSMRIGDTVYFDHHATVSMQLKATAAPYHLLSFLKQLEMLPNIIRFDYLTWNSQSSSDIDMELKLQLLFYHSDKAPHSHGGMF